MSYDNPAYWQDLHRRYSGQLRAVGFPTLSEAFNQLKYASEAATLAAVLDDCKVAPRSGSQLKVVELGAGNGFWCEMIAAYFKAKSVPCEITAMDISQEALATINSRQPGVVTRRIDLTQASPDGAVGEFDLVYSFYCLHHLPRVAGFMNALRFACRSVAPGGRLLIMDPILSQAFSLHDTFDFSTYTGNGVPRHQCFIDDIVAGEGLRRERVVPAVSYVLNGPIEARGRFAFRLRRKIWHTLHKVYRSEAWTRRCSAWVAAWDRRLKRGPASSSSSLCVYRRPPAG